MRRAELARALGVSGKLSEEELTERLEALPFHARPRVVGGEIEEDREEGRLLRRRPDGLWDVAWDQEVITAVDLVDVELCEVAS